MTSSFAYVYDERLAEPKFQRDLSLFEADLASAGIGGRIARLSLFRKIKDTVEDFVRDGIRHVVIVGDDGTLLRMMWFLPELPVTIGFVPLIGPSAFSDVFRIENVSDAIKACTARRTETFDVGKVGDKFFLTKVVIPDTRAELEVDGRFRLRPTEGGTIVVSNFGEGDPCDGTLDVRVKPSAPVRASFWGAARTESPETVLRLTEGFVRSEEPVTLLVDGQTLQGTSFKIGVLPKRIKFLVGKDTGVL